MSSLLPYAIIIGIVVIFSECVMLFFPVIREKRNGQWGSIKS